MSFEIGVFEREDPSRDEMTAKRPVLMLAVSLLRFQCNAGRESRLTGQARKLLRVAQGRNFMQVREAMTKDVQVVSPKQTIREAAKTMLDNHA